MGRRLRRGRGVYLGRTDTDGDSGVAGVRRGLRRADAGFAPLVNNMVIDGDGDQATMRCYLQLFKTGSGGPATLVTTARYEDTLRRVDGAWRFASRTVVPD